MRIQVKTKVIESDYTLDIGYEIQKLELTFETGHTLIASLNPTAGQLRIRTTGEFRRKDKIAIPLTADAKALLAVTGYDFGRGPLCVGSFYDLDFDGNREFFLSEATETVHVDHIQVKPLSNVEETTPTPTPAQRIVIERFDLRDYQNRPRLNFTRANYHRGLDPFVFSVEGRSNTEEVNNALQRIPFDSDGIRRSYGIEYEIYSTTPLQRSVIAYLLRDLKEEYGIEYVFEKDASLSSDSGVEIVILPVSKATYIAIVCKFRQLVEMYNIDMYNTGMHTTYGVSNSDIGPKEKLQKRLSSIALLVNLTMTGGSIEERFGRTFTGFASLPHIDFLAHLQHNYAFSANGRPTTCWECRLCNWKCDPVWLTKFFEATEWVFDSSAVLEREYVRTQEFLQNS